MGTKALWRFDETTATRRPIDAIGAVAELWQSPIKFATAAAMRDIIGWGDWQAAWHVNEASGNLVPAFGTPSMVPSGSPLYLLTGPRGASDRAIGFDSFADSFGGGDVYDPLSGDLNVAFVTKVGSTDADLIGKYAGAGGIWLLRTEVASFSYAFRFIISDGITPYYHNISAGTFSVGDWVAGLSYIDRSGNGSGLILKSLTTGTVVESVNAGAGSLGSINNTGNLTFGNQGLYGAAGTPPLDFVAIGALEGSAAGLHANRSTAIANFAGAWLSKPSVVDAAAGRGRSFVAMSGHGFEGADIVSGGTLITRNASVQALVKWDLADQAQLGTWALTSDTGNGWTGYARSNETLDGDFWIEMTIPATGTFMMLGVRRASDATEGLGGFNRYWYINQNVANQLTVWEGGSGVYSSGASGYAAGDRLRLERVGNVFKYWHKAVGGAWTLKYTGVTDSSTMVVSATALGTATFSSIRLYAGLFGSGTRKAISWNHLVEMQADAADHRGALYARGKGGSAAEYLSAGVELRVVNAALGLGEIAWLWQDTSGVLKRQVGGQFAPPSVGYLMLTATRRWVSSTKVILRYFVGDRMLAEIESVDGSIGGGTTGTTTVGARFDGSVWGDFFDGVIDELRVVDYELAPEEIEATWLRLTRDQPQGYQLVRELHPPDFPISDDPSSRVQRETNLWGQALGFAAAQGENVRANVLPDRAYGDVLTRWEEIVGARPGPNDTIDQRRARVLGRLRARAGVSIPGVRDALVELAATDPDNVEILGFRQEVTDNYREAELWSFDTFRPADVNKWLPTFSSEKCSTVQKTSGASAWDAGASTVNTFPGDVWIQATGTPASVGSMFGLSADDVNQSHTDIDFALHLEGGSVLNVIEGGVFKFASTWAIGDRVQVKRTGTTVTYHKNDAAAFYTSLTASSGTVLIDTSIYTPGAELFRINVKSDNQTLTWQNLVGVLTVTNPTRVVVLGGTAYGYEGSNLKEWTTSDLSISSSSQYKAVIDGVTVPLEGFGAQLATRVDPSRMPVNSEVGIAFHDNARNTSLLFGFRRNSGGTYEIVTERIVDGVSLGAVVRSATSIIPHWLKLYSVAPVPAAYVAPSSSAWDMIAAWSTTGPTSGFTSYAFTHTPRFQWASLYARSIGAVLANTVDVDFGDTRLWTPYGDRSLHFYAYRPAALAGTPDTEAAHFALQGLKQAHTHGTIITSKSVKYDTEGGGYDRGPLGGL